MNNRFLLFITAVIFGFSIASAAVLKGVAVDASNGEPLAACAVGILPTGQTAQTDIDGNFAFTLKPGTYTIRASYVGFDEFEKKIELRSDSIIDLRLQPSTVALREVTVAARESTGTTTASVIDKSAMKHIQASSFSDLMELLPGNVSQDPAMGKVNSIQLRETGNLSATGAATENPDYAMSALGTRFTVDGAPLSNDANLQSVGIESATGRNSVGRGVDMRSLSTDNIESVEIVRGIPSAEYGNLTSGLVKIRRTRAATPWTARFKADGYSKLFYAGKGFGFGPGLEHTMNIDAGYLDSKVDPRNNLENFKRITASARAAFRWDRQAVLTRWNLGLDFTGTIDRAKTDPDLSLIKIDGYKADNNRYSFTSDLNFQFPGRKGLSEVDFNAMASLQNDRLHRRRQVAPQRATVAPGGYEEGVHDGTFILNEYIADYLSEGKPMTLFAKIKTAGAIPSGYVVTQNWLAGAEVTFEKNYGRGQVYDLSKPLNASWTSRPRSYKDIPGLTTVDLYAEDALTAPIARNSLEVRAGVHATTLVGLDSRYRIANRPYVDPRINATWKFPSFTAGRLPMEFLLAGGWGLNSKMPTVDYLFPQKAYLDILQLSYYSPENPAEDSRVNIRTYINDATNYDLRAARNAKWEVRMGLSWGANRLSVTYFEEHMNSGFRYSTVYDKYDYTKYDPSGITGGRPDLDKLPSEETSVLRGYRKATNGSTIDKRGIEFQLNTARWKPVATSLIVTGAWFRTLYSNSQMLFDPVNDVVGGVAVSDRYIGLYNTNDGRVNSQFNTNFMFDTQIPKLGLVFTTTFQCMWFQKTRRLRQNGTPDKYLSAVDGLLHDYYPNTGDPFLDRLEQYYNPELYNDITIPTAVYINLKATKNIGKKLRVAVFVNRLLDYLPAYTANGLTVRRTADAYFGMELNFTL